MRKSPSPLKHLSRQQLKLLVCLVLTVATLVAFWPVYHSNFVHVDDGDYVLENPRVRTGLTPINISWAFTATHAFNWHPLTWLSHMLDCQLFGVNPRGPHLVNLLLHLANTLLLFLFFAKVTGALWPSALVGALFALHPLHVESVAWVAERKDLLSALFWLATMWAYLWYTRGESLARYLLVVLCLGLGLMAKPMLVTLPLVLLLLDWWPLGRFGAKGWRRLLGEKVPLLALVAASCLLTLRAQAGAMASLQQIPLAGRLANALVAYVGYLAKMFWPSRLAVFYPHPWPALPAWQALAAALLLAGISYLVVRYARRRPYLAVGWFWYLGTLVPVIGLVQVGGQAMADRYTYLPLIGIFLSLAWGLADLAAGRRLLGRALTLLAAGALLVCLVLTRVQAGYWRDSTTLLEHAKEVTTNNFIAYTVLIELYGLQGKVEEARAMFRQAITANPGYWLAYDNFGKVLTRQGEVEKAVTLFQQAIRLQPDYADPYINLGKIYGNQGKLAEAMAMFQKAVDINPYMVEAYVNLGKGYANQGNADAAIAMFRKAMEVKPDFAAAYSNLGVEYAMLGKAEEALGMFEKALRLDPDFVEAYNNLGIAYAQQGRTDEAIALFEKALRINPKHLDTYYNLGLTYANQGRVPEALDLVRRARELKPDDPRAQKFLEALSGS